MSTEISEDICNDVDTVLLGTQERRQKINDARQVLDWLEDHPNVPLPTQIDYDGFSIVSLNTKEEAAALVKEFGSCEKLWVDDIFQITKRFGSSRVKAIFWREQICERVVVGTEEVPERIEAAHRREIVEWKCTESLLEGVQ